MTDSEGLVTMQEAIKITGLTERTLRRYVKTGRLAVTRAGSRTGVRILFSEEDLRRITAPEEADTTGQTGQETIRGDRTKRTGTKLSGEMSALIEKKDEELKQATYRLGWLEGRIESMQKALTEGADIVRLREEALEKERQVVLELDRYLQDERQRRMVIEREKAALEARVRELEQPWWRKVLGLRPNGFGGVQGNPATASR
jgi:DNA-binding transcriptional MerR regulator